DRARGAAANGPRDGQPERRGREPDRRLYLDIQGALGDEGRQEVPIEPSLVRRGRADDQRESKHGERQLNQFRISQSDFRVLEANVHGVSGFENMLTCDGCASHSAPGWIARSGPFIDGSGAIRIDASASCSRSRRSKETAAATSSAPPKSRPTR